MLRLRLCMCSHILPREIANCELQPKIMTAYIMQYKQHYIGASTTIMYLYWYQIGGVVTIWNCLIGVNFVYSFVDWNVYECVQSLCELLQRIIIGTLNIKYKIQSAELENGLHFRAWKILATSINFQSSRNPSKIEYFFQFWNRHRYILIPSVPNCFRLKL